MKYNRKVYTHTNRAGRKTTQTLIVLLIIFGAFIGYLILDLIVGIFFNAANSTYVKMARPCSGRYEPTERGGVTTFVTDSDFKVLVIADTHIGVGILSGNEDRLALRAISRLVHNARPDLVVVAGDIIYTTQLQTLNNNNIKAMKLIAELFERMNVYWAPVFGNHDSEDADYTREELGGFLEGKRYGHCLFKKGPKDIDGIGNYVINVENSAGAITRTLYFLDTNEYVEKHERYTKEDTKYDNVHANQIEWYEREVSSQNAKNAVLGAPPPKSTMFVHIPFVQYKTAHARGKIVYGKRRENMCPGRDYGMFDKIVELGSTEAVFCGHDHTNDFAAEYEGVRLCYSMSIDYIAYVWTKYFNPARGGSVITFEGDSYTTQRMRPSGFKVNDQA